MLWILTLKEFGPYIQHIAGIYNIVADTLSSLSLENINQDKSSTMNDSSPEKELFAFNNDEDDEVYFPLALPIVQREKQKKLNQRNSKLKADLTK